MPGFATVGLAACGWRSLEGRFRIPGVCGSGGVFELCVGELTLWLEVGTVELGVLVREFFFFLWCSCSYSDWGRFVLVRRRVCFLGGVGGFFSASFVLEVS